MAPKRMPRHMAPRRLAIVGLGNYTHPLTRHSIGQILLQNLAKRAAADPLLRSGSSTLKSARHGMRHAWVAEMVLHPRPDSEDNKPLELRFIVPKSPMNLTGRTALGFFWQWLPTIARSQPKPGSPEALALAEKGEQWWDAVEVDKEVNIAAEERRLAKEEAEQPKRVKSMYRLLTLQDNLDLFPSKYLYQRGGGSKGHNGLRNVIEKYQTERFHRIWVGIGRPERREDVAEWVLGPLTRDEVEACEYDEETKHEGEVLAKAYKEMMRIGYDEPA
ncbi:peptidyl-tRNA hydrolase, PTH1 family [Rhodotorula toruloides NP11]|nr:peptidyl-tRNA hydrolase, PTH1 family [Rhodotorula toruloides NP11]EMS22171.1 peptidyl-tRNA hydrolase, PTH1 family [Rhodotorula toruloides NP11]